MSTITFDTLKFVETLEDAGVDRKQASAFAVAVRDSHESAELATKADLRELEVRMNARFEAIDSRFEAIDARFESINTKFDAINSKFEGLNSKFEALEHKMTIKLGSLLVAGIVLIIAVLKFPF